MNISIRKSNETVFFLGKDGFKKGKIKFSHARSEKGNDFEISYRVIEDGWSDSAGGYEKNEDEVWSTKEEMMQHYSKSL